MHVAMGQNGMKEMWLYVIIFLKTFFFKIFNIVRGLIEEKREIS